MFITDGLAPWISAGVVSVATVVGWTASYVRTKTLVETLTQKVKEMADSCKDCSKTVNNATTERAEMKVYIKNHERRIDAIEKDIDEKL